MGVDNIDVLYTDAALEGEDIKNKKLMMSSENLVNNKLLLIYKI